VNQAEYPRTLWFVLPVVAMWAVSAFAFDSAQWINVKGGTWSPTPGALADLEAALRPTLIPAAQKRGRLPKWEEYTFQYQGRSTLLGRQFVYVNALCSHEGRNLSQDWVTVFDGGACYFSAKYDPATKRIYDLVVNGVG
jgi:hypothetical protein